MDNTSINIVLQSRVSAEEKTRHLFFWALVISLSSFVLMKTVWPHAQEFKYIAPIGLALVLYRFFIVLSVMRGWQLRLILISCPSFLITACIVDLPENVIYPYFFAVSAYNISFRKIIKYFLLINVTIWLLTTFAAVVHILPNISGDDREILDAINLESSGETAWRYNYGYNYPTDYAAHLTYICIMWFVIRGRNVRYYDYVLFLLGAIHVYRNCDARLDTICIVLTLLLFFIYNHSSHSSFWSWRIVKKGIIYASVMAAALIILLTCQYRVYPTDEIIMAIDLLSSGRLNLGAKALDEYGISVLGQYIKFYYHDDPVRYNFIDSSFVQLLIVYGVLFFLFSLFCHIYINKKNMEKLQLYVPLAICIVSLHSVVFQGLMNFQFNPFYLGLFAIQDITELRMLEDSENLVTLSN